MATLPGASFLSNVRSSIFGGVSNPPAPVAAAPGSDTAPPGSHPANPIPAAPAVDPNASPLDAYKDLWNTAKTDPNAPTPVSPTAFFTDLDQTKMLESARKVNFTQNVNPELLTRAAAGGEDGVKALLAIINDVGQQAYANGTFAAAKLTGHGLDQFDTITSSRLPGKIKQTAFKENLLNDNPAFAHPSAAPIIQAISNQMAVKFPNASATELHTLALGYLQDFAGAINGPATAAAKAKNEAAAPDFSKFFE